MKNLKLLIAIIICLMLFSGCASDETPEDDNIIGYIDNTPAADDTSPVVTAQPGVTPIVTTEPIDETIINNLPLPEKTISQVLEETDTLDFFDDAVFLGDSITVGLESYVKNKRKTDSGFLGEAIFLARVSYSLSDTLKADGYHMHPEYKGQNLQPPNSLKAMGAKKVFIMLGVNDAAGNVDTIVNNYKKLVNNIRSKNPDIRIYIIAVFPMTQRKESASRNNDKIDSINAKLLSYATQESIPFIDINPSFKTNGIVNKDYYSDDYVHLNSKGYEIYTKQLQKMAKLFSLSDSKTGRITNVEENVNARKRPDTASEIVTTIAKNAVVTIVSKTTTGWYEVLYNGEKMYVYGKYVGYSVNEDLACVVDNVSENANLRTKPSVEASLVDSVRKDTVLAVVPNYYTQSWYQVLYDDKICYIYKPLVS